MNPKPQTLATLTAGGQERDLDAATPAHLAQAHGYHACPRAGVMPCSLLPSPHTPLPSSAVARVVARWQRKMAAASAEGAWLRTRPSHHVFDHWLTCETRKQTHALLTTNWPAKTKPNKDMTSHRVRH